MKRAMTWLDISVWLSEVWGSIAGGYIDNIYGGAGRLAIKIRRSAGEPVNLEILPGEAIYITTRTYARTGSPTHVALGFRKYLRDLAIEQISQPPCERIVEIAVRRGSQEYKVVVELIPRGITAAVDPNGIVKAVTRPLEARDRVVRVGSKYSYPPSQPGICSRDPSKLVEGVMRGYDLVRGLVLGANIPPDVAEEALYRLGVRKSVRPSELGVETLRGILEGVLSFIEEVKRSPEPGVAVDAGGSPQGFYPFEPKHLSPAGYSFKRLSSLNDAIDLFYAYAGPTVKRERSPELVRVERGIEKLRSQVEEARRSLETMRRVVEYMEQNYQAIEEAFECVRKGLQVCREAVASLRGSAAIVGGSLELDVGGYRYRLDPRLSFMENYFVARKRVSELEKRISRGSEEIARLEEEAKKIYVEEERRRAVEAIKRLKRPEWYERYHWIITSEGLLAIGGMDADQNERIVRRYLKDNYIFLHADIQGGSAVILFTDRKYTHRSIEEAGRIAACYSRAWGAGYGSIDVFYVKGSQVSKSPPPGQYLGKGSFMIYGERGWIRGVPLELGIGIQLLEEEVPRIIVGPPDLVSSQAAVWSIVAPGDTGRREAAEYLIKKWLESGRVKREVVEAVEVDELVKRLPGRVRILPPKG